MTDRIRVLRLVPVLDFGGVETGLVVQSERTDRARFDLRVATFWKPGNAAEKVRAFGTEVDVLDVDPRIRNPRASLALLRLLRRVRPHIVHASVPEADFHAGLVGRLGGSAVILDEAGMPSRKGIARRIFTALHKNVDGIIGVSDALCEHLATHEGAPRARLHRIYNCGASAYFGPPKTDFRPSSPFRFVAVGRHVDVKNHAVLIAAMKAVPGATLEIVGRGPLTDDYRRAAEAAAVADRVLFPGFVDDLPAFLRAADAYCIPSHSEGCSLSLIEAMASGLPVLGSRVPGNIEVMGDLGSAFMAAPKDVDAWAAAMRSLVAMKPAQRAALGESARRIAVERFSPQVYVDSLERLYTSVYEERR